MNNYWSYKQSMSCSGISGSYQCIDGADKIVRNFRWTTFAFIFNDNLGSKDKTKRVHDKHNRWNSSTSLKAVPITFYLVYLFRLSCNFY